MSEIGALKNYVKGRIVILGGDNAGSFASEIDRTLAMWRQTQATLALAEQVKRIADLLEQTSIENDDGTRTLYLMAGVERIG